MVPASPEEITAGWLGTALRDAGVIEDDHGVGIEVEHFGGDRGLTGCVARVRWSLTDGSGGHCIAKLPAVTDDWLRCVREVRFYTELPGPAGLPLPRLLHAGVDDDAKRIVMLLEDVGGVDGDILGGCSLAATRLLLDTIAGMHARWWNDERLDVDWLPRWGRGSRGTPEPHARRAERYRKRIEPFTNWYRDLMAPGLIEALDSTAESLPHHLEIMTGQPLTLIHADLHLDNIAFDRVPEPTVAMILDWQSASRGPAVYDLVRLLTGTLRSAEQHAACGDLVAHYLDALRRGGVPERDLQGVRAAIPSTARAVLAGYVSGYGRRGPDVLQERERLSVEHAAGADGLAGLVVSLLRGT